MSNARDLARVDVNTSGEIAAANLANAVAFPSGTLMLFIQTAAPTGWTKSITHDDKALRVVSGTAGTGGSAAFTTAFGTPSVTGSVSVSVSGTVGATTLSSAQMPSHSHSISLGVNAATSNSSVAMSNQPATSSRSTAAAGSSGSHDHSWSGSGSGSLSAATASISVAYVDAIIATKD